jgi:hypothetical protein
MPFKGLFFRVTVAVIIAFGGALLMRFNQPLFFPSIVLMPLITQSSCSTQITSSIVGLRN